MKLHPRVKLACLLLLLPGTLLPLGTLASTTSGTIDPVYKYAWSENIGWLNFGTSGGNVHVTDTAVTGYVWSDGYGWINLAPSASGVTNNAEGDLAGSAWGEGLGYIDFNNVSIDSNGIFSGTATGVQSGTINFNSANSIKVVTDWRPASVRAGTGTTIVPGGGGSSGGGGQLFPLNPVGVVTDAYRALILAAQNGLLNLVARITDRVSPTATSTPSGGPGAITVFSGVWQLLAETGRRDLVFAPLPPAVRLLTKSLPQLDSTFTKVGVSRFTDLSKLTTARLNLPSLSDSIGAAGTIPLAKLNATLKSKLPPEIIFARAGHELIDLQSVLSLSAAGEPEQQIDTVVGKQLTLVIRPESPTKSVTGYVVFRSKGLAMMSGRVAPFNLTAALGLVKAEPPTSLPVEQKLVLQEFIYTDPDGDGLYTATINAPLVGGEYEIMSVIEYVDPALGKKIVRLVTVVDPEGYVYEAVGGREVRVPSALVSLFWLNPATKNYELWPAGEYQQTNPQTTGKSGSYSFLVPPGDYSLHVTADGYKDYVGESFNVSTDNGVHTNIELKSTGWWPSWLNWQTILLIMVVLLLIYQVFRDKLRNK